MGCVSSSRRGLPEVQWAGLGHQDYDGGRYHSSQGEMALRYRDRYCCNVHTCSSALTLHMHDLGSGEHLIPAEQTGLAWPSEAANHCLACSSRRQVGWPGCACSDWRFIAMTANSHDVASSNVIHVVQAALCNASAPRTPFNRYPPDCNHVHELIDNSKLPLWSEMRREAQQALSLRCSGQALTHLLMSCQECMRSCYEH